MHRLQGFNPAEPSKRGAYHALNGRKLQLSQKLRHLYKNGPQQFNLRMNYQYAKYGRNRRETF